MKDVKKTVFWVLVGFCVISAFFGIFNLIASLQMSVIPISQIRLSDELKTFLSVNTAITIICAILCLALGVLAVVHYFKRDNAEKSKFVLQCLIATAVISVIFSVYPFLIPTILKVCFKDHVWSDYDSLYYEIFLHCQAYLSAALSTFLPLVVSAGLVLCNVLCGDKCKKQDAPEEPAEK